MTVFKKFSIGYPQILGKYRFPYGLNFAKGKIQKATVLIPFNVIVSISCQIRPF